jgi:hypothetical protein
MLSRNAAAAFQRSTATGRLSKYFQQIVRQSFDNIASILANLLVFEALIAGVTLSVMLTITADEFINGDIVALAFSSRNFRCRFAPNSTYDICSGPGNFSADFCKSRGAAHRIGCDLDVFRSIIIGDCEIANLIESRRRIANSVDKESVLVWIAETVFAGRTDVNDSYLGGAPVASAAFQFNIAQDSGPCLPSMMVASYGFTCLHHTLLTLFLSLFVFLSINLSRSREDFVDWWFPGGILFLGFICQELMYSAFYFLHYAEYVIAIRYPYPQHSSLWKHMIMFSNYPGGSQNSFWSVTFQLCLPLVVAHFTLVKIFGMLKTTLKAWSNLKGVIDCSGSDDCKNALKLCGFDIDKIKSIENDLLLREELISAGMTDPQDRLCMIKYIRFAFWSYGL